jgi:hypothetical protein
MGWTRHEPGNGITNLSSIAHSSALCIVDSKEQLERQIIYINQVNDVVLELLSTETENVTSRQDMFLPTEITRKKFAQ